MTSRRIRVNRTAVDDILKHPAIITALRDARSAGFREGEEYARRSTRGTRSGTRHTTDPYTKETMKAATLDDVYILGKYRCRFKLSEITREHSIRLVVSISAPVRGYGSTHDQHYTQMVDRYAHLEMLELYSTSEADIVERVGVHLVAPLVAEASTVISNVDLLPPLCAFVEACIRNISPNSIIPSHALLRVVSNRLGIPEYAIQF